MVISASVDDTLSEPWRALVSSIEIHRDKRARFYKPVCLFAAAQLVLDGTVSSQKIDPNLVIERFSLLVRSIFPGSADRGWMPFWHLTRDGAWHCYKDNRRIHGSEFPAGKPKTQRQLLRHVDYAKVLPEVRDAWSDPQAINHLMDLIIMILDNDDDVAAQAMGEYLQCRYRTNRDDEQMPPADSDLEIDSNTYLDIEDYSRFRAHICIERKSSIVKKVKRVQGVVCRLCGLTFLKGYGSIGSDFIEVHHLVPIASRKGQKVELDTRNDFAVLCANCHRMIHRYRDPGDLKGFLSDNKVPCYTG